MRSARAYRLVEGTLVFLFFWQAVRLVCGLLLGLTTLAIETGQVDFTTINAYLMLLAALAVPWFAPRSRRALPRTLLLSATLAAIVRVPMSIDNALVRLIAGVSVIGFGGMYLAALIRANWRTWVISIASGLILDLFLRASDTFDPSIRSAVTLTLGESVFRLAWLVPQIVLSASALLFAWLSRKTARNEPYEPASLTVWGGVGVGGFLALQLLVTGAPNVIARWSGVSYLAVVFWLILFTALPIIPAVRAAVGLLLGLFDDRLRGWVWLFVLLLALVVGNRVGGLFGAAALIVAQFMAILTLWWLPHTHESSDQDQAGPSFSLGLFLCVLLVYGYSLTFERFAVFGRFYEQGLIIALISGGLLGVARLLWREDDPWLASPLVTNGLAVCLIMPAVIGGWLQASLGAEVPRPTPETTVSVATYDLNSGYDAGGNFELELAARTIEASLADIVVLQHADTGRPVGFGVDQVEFLARRLRMNSAYQSDAGKLLGVAVLSRWSIAERRSALLQGASGSSPALLVSLRDPATGRAMTVVAAYLVPGSEQSRLNQTLSLQTFIGDASPLALGVNLGASPEDNAYQQLMAGGYLDPDVTLGIERGFTTPANNPTFRSDYLLLRGLAPLASRHVNSAASTHRLVVVEVGFPQ